MPNWERTPAVSGMSVEEMKKRVAAGIKKRRELGELRPAGMKVIETVADGPVLSKKHRRVLVQAAELAIYSLANNEREDYCGAAEAMNAVRRQCGFDTGFMKAMLEGVAEQAAELAGEQFEILDQLARHWLADYFTPSGKLISITKGNTNGHEQIETKN